MEIILLLRNTARVRGPILPTNILKVMIYLPASERKGVIPVDNPTVPNAETSSNMSLKNGTWGSVNESKRVEEKIRNMANNAIA